MASLSDAVAAVPGKIGDYISGINAAELGYFIGYVAANIAEFFIPVLKVAKLAKAGKLAAAFDEFVAGLARAADETLLMTEKMGRTMANKMLLAIESSIALMRQGTRGIKEFIKNFFEQLKRWLDELAGKYWLSAGIFKFGNDATTLHNFINLRNRAEDGWYNVLCHGLPKNVVIDGKYYNPAELAKFLLDNGYEKGKPIRLFSCSTGQKSNGFAAKLADLIEAEVLAPTDLIQVLENGEFFIKNKGKFVLFKPKTLK